jgi:RNA polymerase sigma-70 factor (ECF subfamily)
MSDNTSIPWGERLRQGDPGAADAVFARYAQQLVRVAEQHLSRRLAARIDGEDVVQSVFRTFFRRASAGQFQIDTSAQLWQLLVRITILKTRAKARFHTAGVRRASAEVGGAVDAVLVQEAGGEPGPAEAAELVDQIEALLAGLPGEFARVLELRLSGDSVADVARQLGLSRQSVYRMLDLLRNRLTALDPDAGPARATTEEPLELPDEQPPELPDDEKQAGRRGGPPKKR